MKRILLIGILVGAFFAVACGNSTPTFPSGPGGADGDGFIKENKCENGPLSAPIPHCNPQAPPSTGDPAQDCVNRINQFRWECQCLPPLKRWREAESCAEKNAKYDASKNTAHAGFTNNICGAIPGASGGMATNECPGWGDIKKMNNACIQMMWNEGPGEPYSKHGHYINMSNRKYTKVACGFGSGWGVHLFSGGN